MSLVTVSATNDVVTLTLNDPERRNALTAEERRALFEALRELEHATTIRAVILTGAGGNFCSGGDLKDMPPASREVADDRLTEIAEIVRRLRDLEVLTIAAVDGIAAGIGVGLAAICDIVVATSRAKFMLPFTKLGLVPDGAALASVAQRVGVARARRLFLQAEAISAETALDFGLADQIVAAEDLEQTVISLAEAQHGHAPASIREVKRFYAQNDLSIEAALMIEARRQPDMYFSSDFLAAKEGFFARTAVTFSRQP